MHRRLPGAGISGRMEVLGFGGAEPDPTRYCSGPAQNQRSHQPQKRAAGAIYGRGKAAAPLARSWPIDNPPREPLGAPDQKRLGVLCDTLHS